MLSIVRKLFGTANDRLIRRMKPTVEKINALEPDFQSLSDDELKAKTQEFRDRLEKGEKLDDLLPEAFATVRDGAKRALGLRH